eukprot:15448228-Alexandrium_andersonii.AAC.1
MGIAISEPVWEAVVHRLRAHIYGAVAVPGPPALACPDVAASPSGTLALVAAPAAPVPDALVPPSAASASAYA